MSVCVLYAWVKAVARVFEREYRNKRMTVLEGWGLWLRSGSAGALLYKAMAYRRLHVTDGVLVRSGFYISSLVVCSLVNGLINAKTVLFSLEFNFIIKV